MSSRTAAGRKRLQQPIVSPHDSEQLVNRPNSFTTTTRADLISSTPRSRDVPRVHTSVQRLDLSNQFTQHLPSQAPEYSHTYFPPSNHVNFRNIESNRAVDAVPSYGPFPLRIDPLVLKYQPPPQSPGALSLDPSSPTTGSFPYVPDSPKYPLASISKHSEHLAASCIQNRSSSPTPSDLPEYCSVYSHMDGHNPFATTNKSTRRDNEYESSLPSPHTQLAALPISDEKRRPFRPLPSVPDHSSSSNYHSSSSNSHERHRDSASISVYSGLSSSSVSTPTSHGTWQPPAPPSPEVFFPGFRSSKIVPISPTVQSPTQSHHPESDEDAFGLSDDYKRKDAPSLPKAPPENFVFPTSRSSAHPKKSSKPKSSKSSIDSSKSKDDNSGRFRNSIIGDFFKKNKGKNKAPEKQISEEPSSHAFTVQEDQTRKLKSSYPLDPYNSVLLENDRYTGELLSRLNPTGSPSFYDYGTIPPSSVLDLGCGQGHWVLEAAIAWNAYGTHVTGFDMVDISSNLLPWATEQGVRDNIQFVKGNFLKQQLPFSSDTFDLVRMSCLTLCITSDSWGFILQEVCRVLVEGGRLEFIDDQIFFPYGKVSSLMDTNSNAKSVISKLDSAPSSSVTTHSIYGDMLANPGLGSTVGHRSSDDHDDGGSDQESGVVVLNDHKGKVTARLPTAQPRVVLSPEAWDRSLSISEDLEALFERMLLDVFDIHKDPSDFILPLMKKIFGQAREVETMNLVLAPPDSTVKSGCYSQQQQQQQQQQGLSHCPGLILWPSTFIPMDHTEVEIHASRHVRILLSCKISIAQHALKVAELEGGKVDEEFISQALWKYESFLQHRFNPPVPASGSSVMPNELTHIRTFRVFEAVKRKRKLGLTYG